ncbi:MAG: FxLYD domain-containing protein [Chloroflexi bacterium]|nr:FxLYD domain-containing protein [Chloroflexota bacterium]
MRWSMLLVIGGAWLTMLMGGCSGAGIAADDALDRLANGPGVIIGMGADRATAIAAPLATITRTATPTTRPTLTPTPTPIPPTPTVTSTPTPVSKPLALVAKGFGQKLGPVGYAFVVENPNPGLAVENSLYQVAAYDDQGKVLRTDSGSIGLLLPGQKLGFASDLFLLKQDSAVARLEVQIKPGTVTSTKPLPALTVDNVSYRHDIWYPKVTGVIKNPYPKAIDRVRVSAILYDDAGGIIGGGASYVKFVPANGEAAVEVNVITSGRPAKVELHPAIGALSQLQ